MAISLISNTKPLLDLVKTTTINNAYQQYLSLYNKFDSVLSSIPGCVEDYVRNYAQVQQVTYDSNRIPEDKTPTASLNAAKSSFYSLYDRVKSLQEELNSIVSDVVSNASIRIYSQGRTNECAMWGAAANLTYCRPLSNEPFLPYVQVTWDQIVSSQRINRGFRVCPIFGYNISGGYCLCLWVQIRDPSISGTTNFTEVGAVILEIQNNNPIVKYGIYSAPNFTIAPSTLSSSFSINSDINYFIGIQNGVNSLYRLINTTFSLSNPYPNSAVSSYSAVDWTMAQYALVYLGEKAVQLALSTGSAFSLLNASVDTLTIQYKCGQVTHGGAAQYFNWDFFSPVDVTGMVTSAVGSVKSELQTRINLVQQAINNILS